jgi:hypothetical protein
MGIVPPDLGLVLEISKKLHYDDCHACFTDGARHVYLVPVGTPSARHYQATSQRERTLSRETYDLLRTGCASETPNVFESPAGSGQLYSLDDDHVEVVARPA